jgi:hypothetical protein
MAEIVGMGLASILIKVTTGVVGHPVSEKGE